MNASSAAPWCVVMHAIDGIRFLSADDEVDDACGSTNQPYRKKIASYHTQLRKKALFLDAAEHQCLTYEEREEGLALGMILSRPRAGLDLL